MFQKPDHEKNHIDNPDNWEDQKSDKYEYEYTSNAEVDDEADIEIDDFITYRFFFLGELIFSKYQVRHNKENSESTTWEEIS